MSSAGSLGVLRSRFNHRPHGDPLIENDPPAQNAQSSPVRAGDVVGPIHVVAPRVVEAPSESIPHEAAPTASPGDELGASRGILLGAALGAVCWGLLGALLYRLLA